MSPSWGGIHMSNWVTLCSLHMQGNQKTTISDERPEFVRTKKARMDVGTRTAGHAHRPLAQSISTSLRGRSPTSHTHMLRSTRQVPYGWSVPHRGGSSCIHAALTSISSSS
eukprot:362009-Chlamydomonas_euryale.AAC.14